MKFEFIASKQVAFPVSAMCRVLGVSPSGYYAFCKRPASARRSTDARLATEIGVAHKRSHGIYGSPRVHQELRAHGVRVSKKRVERLMRENGLQGRQKRRFVRTTDRGTRSPRAQPARASLRKGDPERGPGSGDVTYIATDDGWLYLAVLLDLSSRRVVGWATSATNDRALALAALDQARLQTASRRPVSCITPTAEAHTRATTIVRRWTQRGLVASMSRDRRLFTTTPSRRVSSRLSRPSMSTTNSLPRASRLTPPSPTTSSAFTTPPGDTRRSATSAPSSSN